MSHAPSPGATPAGYNPQVHGARGFLALLIVVYHAWNSGLSGFAWTQPGSAAGFLVSTWEYTLEVFFCISGFVILGTLRRAPGAGAFLIDRVTRIYPVLWASLAVVLPLGLLVGAREFGRLPLSEVLAMAPANLLALPGIVPIWAWHPPAWSLSYEMAFYLLCAGGLALRLRFGARAALAVTLPLGVAACVLYPRALPFLAGMAVAAGLVTRCLPDAVARLARRPLPLLLVFFAGWGVIQALSGERHIMATTLLDWAGDARLPVALVALAAVTLGFQGVVDGHGLVSRMLRQGWVQYLGTVSYSLYLWHLVAMGVMRRVMAGLGLIEASGPWAQLVFLALSLPVALLMAHVSQVLLEDRLRAWLGARLRARLLRPAPRGAHAEAVAAGRAAPTAP